MKKLLGCLLGLISYCSVFAQAELAPPFNIKSIQLKSTNTSLVPYFRLGESMELSFDDLYGDEANYYYTIQHCDYDWQPSQLVKSEYLRGFDDIRIQTYENSFNTLQIYSHYSLRIPNQQTQLLVSGNYVLTILDEARQPVFSKRFVIYEEQVSVPVQVRRARQVADVLEKQNLEFTITSQNVQFQNPTKNINVLITKNGRWDEAIYNLKPQYTLGNDMVYRYDKETQFFGGNEYLYFDNKNVRAAVHNVAKVTSTGDLYESWLYTNPARASKGYTYFPDQNGLFIPSNINNGNPDIEADYTWVHFALDAPLYQGKDKVYLAGWFNNYAQTDEYAMDYNKETGLYEKAVLVKQGFTNYQYEIRQKNGAIDYKNAVDGNFYQTENHYYILVYYRETNARYDRVIGFGHANSQNMIQ